MVRAGGARLFRGSGRWSHGPAADLSADAAGCSELHRRLGRGVRSPIHLLVDLIEEDFQRETAPHVHGRSRRALLATRSARLFPGTPYVSARREGRMREGRRDDRVLFSAILRPERLEPWLDTLRGHEVAGIHSLPLVSAGLLPLLGAGEGRVLLVTENGGGHLRQTLFEDGRLALSRLATLPPGKPAERAERAAAEVERLVHHLGRSGYPANGLRFRLVGSAPLLAAVRGLATPQGLADGLVDAATVERRLGCPSRPRSVERGDASPGGCDRLFARLALSRRAPNHYAPPSVLAVHRTKHAGRTLQATGLAMFLAGAAWSGSAWHRSGDLAGAAERLEREAAGIEARYRAERRPESRVGSEDLRLAVETAKRLDRRRARALPVLRTISEALGGFPDLELERLEWFEISEREGWPAPPRDGAPRERFRIIHLRGRVKPFGGYYRAAADEVFRFAERLEAMPRLSAVDVTDLPHDRMGRDLLRTEAGFEIRVVVDAGDG